jgi:hypothetical protein
LKGKSKGKVKSSSSQTTLVDEEPAASLRSIHVTATTTVWCVLVNTAYSATFTFTAVNSLQPLHPPTSHLRKPSSAPKSINCAPEQPITSTPTKHTGVVHFPAAGSGSGLT